MADRLVARQFGTYMPRTDPSIPLGSSAPFALVRDADAVAEVVGGLRDGLSRDDRVVDLIIPEIDELDLIPFIDYWAAHEAPEDFYDYVSGYRQSPALFEPISFSMRVPPRNQPKFAWSDKFLPDMYFIVWDGVFGLVAWNQNDDEPIPYSAGRAALDALSKAAQAIGMEFRVEHASLSLISLLLRSDSAQDGIGDFARLNKYECEITFDSNLPPTDLVQELFERTYAAGREFFELENTRWSLDSVQAVVDGAVHHGLTSWRAHSRSGDGLREWLRRRLRTWAVLRDARDAIADAWVGIAIGQSLITRGERALQSLEDKAAESGCTALYEPRITDAADYVQSTSFASSEHSLDYLSRSVDNREIVLATAGGALAGGVVGGLVGSLL